MIVNLFLNTNLSIPLKIGRLGDWGEAAYFCLSLTQKFLHLYRLPSMAAFDSGKISTTDCKLSSMFVSMAGPPSSQSKNWGHQPGVHPLGLLNMVISSATLSPGLPLGA